MHLRLLSTTIAFLTCVAAAGAQGDGVKRHNMFKWSDAVVVAKLDKATFGGILYSNPPIYHGQMQLTTTEVIQGTLKVKVTFEAFYRAHQYDAPKYPEGKSCLVCFTYDAPTKTWTVFHIEEVTAENIKEAKAAQ